MTRPFTSVGAVRRAELGALAVAAHGGDGPRTPSVSRGRIRDDLDAVIAAAVELAAGTLAYEDALADCFAALLRTHCGDASAIWSIDGVHAEYIGARDARRAGEAYPAPLCSAAAYPARRP